MAHDFNNLLTAITGYTELALDSLPAGTHGYTPTSRRSSKPPTAPRSLTRQLLAFARKQIIEPRDAQPRTT